MSDKRAKKKSEKSDSSKKAAADSLDTSNQVSENLSASIAPIHEEEGMSIADLCMGAAGQEVNGSHQESIDAFNEWSLNNLMNHPAGMEEALAQNLALMEQKTKELIENGSAEDLMKALEENALQLQMLTDRIANIAKASTAG